LYNQLNSVSLNILIKQIEIMTTTINNINYEIKGELELTGRAAMFGYVSQLILKRPNGTKEFWAMRDINGIITLN